YLFRLPLETFAPSVLTSTLGPASTRIVGFTRFVSALYSVFSIVTEAVSRSSLLYLSWTLRSPPCVLFAVAFFQKHQPLYLAAFAASSFEILVSPPISGNSRRARFPLCT